MAVEVETALKALGIASGTRGRSDDDVWSAVEDLRQSEKTTPATRSLLRVRDIATAPALLASDDDVIVI